MEIKTTYELVFYFWYCFVVCNYVRKLYNYTHSIILNTFLLVHYLILLRSLPWYYCPFCWMLTKKCKYINYVYIKSVPGWLYISPTKCWLVFTIEAMCSLWDKNWSFINVYIYIYFHSAVTELSRWHYSYGKARKQGFHNVCEGLQTIRKRATVNQPSVQNSICP